MKIKAILLCSLATGLLFSPPVLAGDDATTPPPAPKTQPVAIEPPQPPEAADAPEATPLPANSHLAGSYLSGQFARTNGQVDAGISSLRRIHREQPDNMTIAVQLQGMLLLEGQLDEAMVLAQDIHESGAKDPLADLLLALHAIKTNNLDTAADILAGAADNGSVQLWAPLLAGWVDISRHKLVAPLTVDSLNIDTGRVVPLVNYHLALINNNAGFKEAAAQDFKSAIEDPHEPPTRIMKALLKFYDQNGSPETLAPLVKMYQEFQPQNAADTSPAPNIATPEDGIAEVLYTMGGIMFGAGVSSDAAIYLRLAVYMKPDLYEAVMALGDAYGELQQLGRSNEAYGKIPAASPLYTKAQLHIAVNYDRAGKLKDALSLLDKMIKQSPKQSDALVAKGDLLRIHARYGEAVEAYTQALARIPELQSDDWPILFARASCYDRENKWPQAEKDLQAALELKPDQPDILNYLGFARLEHGEDSKSAAEMIAKAVKARPNDPQIVDSMGWALYQQGDYIQAAGYIEKAVELLPGDPTVNDHLGDAYWRLGRKTEARFQWQRSLTFSPDEKLVAILHKKLKDGLPPAATLANSAPSTMDKPALTATP